MKVKEILVSAIELIAVLAILVGLIVWSVVDDSGEVITGENYTLREATLEISDLSSGTVFNYNRKLPYWKLIVEKYDTKCTDEYYITQLSNNDTMKQEAAEFFSKILNEHVDVVDYYYCGENQEYKIKGVLLVGRTPYIFEMHK